MEQVFWANRWTEAWWISMLDDEITSSEDEADEDCRAGGRKPRKIAEEVAGPAIRSLRHSPSHHLSPRGTRSGGRRAKGE